MKTTSTQIAKNLGVTTAQVRAGLLRNAKSMRGYSDADLKRMGKTRAEVNAIADDYEKRGNPLAELQAMIAGTVAAFADKKMRAEAMQAIQWRLRGPNGEFVGLGGLHGLQCSFVPESAAFVFDGRDNEKMKLATYEAALGELTVEILPQILCAS